MTQFRWEMGGLMAVGVIGAVLAGAGDLLAQETEEALLPPSTVVVVERPEVVQAFNVDGAAVRRMFTRGLLTLTGKKSTAAAWKDLGVTPQDVVGIKITTDGGPLFSTKRALVGIIVSGLQKAGVPAQNIIIWDKHRDIMEKAQWPPLRGSATTPATMAVLPDTGWDGEAFYVNEVVGKLIYGDHLFKGKAKPAVKSTKDLLKAAFPDSGSGSRGSEQPPDDQISNKSFFAEILSKRCTKIINVPVLTDSDATGLYGAMGSLAVGSVDNTRRFTGRPYFGDPAIPEIMEEELIRSKVILHVLDALIAQYAGGPKFNPQFTKSIGALYLSKDPVAIDALVLQRINAWREAERIDPLGRQVQYIQTADEFGLGNADPSRIRVVELNQ